MHNAGTCSNHTSTPLTQTASSTMEKAGLDINTLYAGKLNPVTGTQTLADNLTDAASTSQFEVLPKMDISFPYLENMSLQLSIIELSYILCIFADCTCRVSVAAIDPSYAE